MGISPRVYLANFFLWTCEYAHLLSLCHTIQVHPPPPIPLPEVLAHGELYHRAPAAVQTALGHAAEGCLAMWVLQQERHVFRFVDDLQAVGDLVLDALLYDDQYLHGTSVQGIYPRACPLEDRPPPGVAGMPFLDLLQEFRNVGGLLRVDTSLYDKRAEPAFSGVHMVQYTHASSALSRSCLSNIPKAQLARLLRIHSQSMPCALAVVVMLRKLVQQGHPPAVLWKVVSAYLSTRPWLLHQHPRQSVSAFLVRVRNLLQIVGVQLQ